MIRRRTYRRPSRLASLTLRRWIVAVLLAFGLAGGSTGCGATTEEVREENAQMPEAVNLYEATLEEFNARQIPVATASKDYLVVASEFESVSRWVRRRYVATVLVVRRGIALNVQAEFQRLEAESEVWKPTDEPVVKQRARREENDLGRAIQARYRSTYESR